MSNFRKILVPNFHKKIFSPGSSVADEQQGRLKLEGQQVELLFYWLARGRRSPPSSLSLLAQQPLSSQFSSLSTSHSSWWHPCCPWCFQQQATYVCGENRNFCMTELTLRPAIPWGLIFEQMEEIGKNLAEINGNFLHKKINENIKRIFFIQLTENTE